MDKYRVSKLVWIFAAICLRGNERFGNRHQHDAAFNMTHDPHAQVFTVTQTGSVPVPNILITRISFIKGNYCC